MKPNHSSLLDACHCPWSLLYRSRGEHSQSNRIEVTSINPSIPPSSHTIVSAMMNTNNSAGEEFNDEGNVHGDGTTTEGDGKKSMASDLWSLVKPYKKEILANQILEHEPGDDRRAAIINCLRDMGVKVFIIEARSIETTGDILHHVHRVVDYVSRENQQFGAGYIDEEGNPVDPLGFQRCLLYQDRSGRLFNLMLSSHAVGPAGKFESLLTSFSGLEAMALVTVLCRTFACVAQGAL